MTEKAILFEWLTAKLNRVRLLDSLINIIRSADSANHNLGNYKNEKTREMITISSGLGELSFISFSSVNDVNKGPSTPRRFWKYIKYIDYISGSEFWFEFTNEDHLPNNTAHTFTRR